MIGSAQIHLIKLNYLYGLAMLEAIEARDASIVALQPDIRLISLVKDMDDEMNMITELCKENVGHGHDVRAVAWDD